MLNMYKNVCFKSTSAKFGVQTHMQPMVLEYESQHLPHVYDPIFWVFIYQHHGSHMGKHFEPDFASEDWIKIAVPESPTHEYTRLINQSLLKTGSVPTVPGSFWEKTHTLKPPGFV